MLQLLYIAEIDFRYNNNYYSCSAFLSLFSNLWQHAKRKVTEASLIYHDVANSILSNFIENINYQSEHYILDTINYQPEHYILETHPMPLMYKSLKCYLLLVILFFVNTCIIRWMSGPSLLIESHEF